MGIPSFSELIIIFAVVFLLFGAKKLPELGGAIGESIKNFKKGIRDDDTETKRLAERSGSTGAGGTGGADAKPVQPANQTDNNEPPKA
jgi:sec-independent protein translocase protein TatA